tara:strand:- start:401 stop:1093 length:693 start_codon:yes stop_codon:yes gene_type:complete
MEPAPESGTLIWDLPLRVFHWLLVLSLLGSWATSEYEIFETTIHFYFGYLALTLLTFRFLWGIFGTHHSRFRTFLRGPKVVFRYLRGLDSSDNYAGHNPIGGWATILLLLLVLLQAVTGLFISDDIVHAGPYNAVVSEKTADFLALVHYLNFDLLLIACGVHLFAALLYQFVYRKGLIRAMLTGRKPMHAFRDERQIEKHDLQRGILCFMIASLSMALIVGLAPEPVFDF